MRVELSGGNLPGGLQDSADGCDFGICATWSADNVVIGSRSFRTGFVLTCSVACGANDSGYFQMKTAGKYTRFDGTFGIAADSPGSDKTQTLELTLADQGTGKVLYSKTLEYGRTYTLKGLDISHVGLLRITFAGPLASAHGAVGAPVVHR
ncbi:hypothetical protein [Streptomyces bungoensis]|uniref:hypothetical protein n=1 Tax=Streptomyces bungoensis TaxID=285568 RepID=UPI00131DFD02|nr:hypothetical protein [Streptomyces bungoensis]